MEACGALLWAELACSENTGVAQAQASFVSRLALRFFVSSVELGRSSIWCNGCVLTDSAVTSLCA